MKQNHLLSIACICTLAMATVANAAVMTTFRQGLDGYTGTQDAGVKSNDVNSTFNGGTMTVKRTNPDSRVYIHFDDIFGEGAGQITALADVNSITASLSIWQTRGSVPPTINVHQVTSAWSEATITWNNLPTTGSQLDSKSTSSSWHNGNNPLVLDVTAAVKSWFNATDSNAANYGFRIVAAGGGQNPADIHSSENGTDTRRPTLTVEYDVIPEPASMALMGLGSLMMLWRRSARIH